tara:strand:- start:2216 stop:2680 length:465 start_codon:yes stop_codon:yes gene_type:complete
MINLVQTREYRFDLSNDDPYNNIPLDECAMFVRKEIKAIIEKWQLQPNPERDAKGKVPRNRQTPYWCAYRDMFIGNGFQAKDVNVLQIKVNQALLDKIEEKRDAIEELEHMEENSSSFIASPKRVIVFLEQVMEQMEHDKNYVNQHLNKLLDNM